MNRKRKSSESAFTLVEMLVATAVFSILMLSLAQFYSTFVRAARQSSAYASIDQSTTLVVDRMAKAFKSAAKGGQVPGENPFEFIGKDGDNAFVNRGDTPHQELISNVNPNDVSDRVHFHALLPNRLEDNTGADPNQTDRVYFAFWLNGKSSPVTKDELQESWGILSRKRFHEGSDTVPHYPEPGSPKQSPVTNLNSSSVSHSGSHPVNILGRNIDYLSFQYYDSRTNKWVNSWNTRDSEAGRFPASVRIAIRGYDRRADHSNPRDPVPPEWQQTTVNLGGD